MSKEVIYQVFPRYFGNDGRNIPSGTIEENGCGKFSDFTKDALKSISELGVTHIWYTGVLEHATQTDYIKDGVCRDHPAVVKGKAGSPYAIKDYYDVACDLADVLSERLDEFSALVQRTHDAGLKVIIDFVPNHVARKYHSDVKPEGVRDFGQDDFKKHAFDPYNSFYYIVDQQFKPDFDLHAPCGCYEEYPAKATGNDCFTANPTKNDWYETVKLNYGVDYLGGGKKHFDPVPATWFKMLHILEYWASKGVDGFRCDMAEMVPVEFWGWVIPRLKANNPTLIFIAEVYNPSLYWEYIHQGHFDFLYDKEGMYNTLRSIIEGHASASNITHCWQSTNDIQQHMLGFLENHDEQRIASDFFAKNPFKAIPGMFVLTTYHKNPVMIYAGQELGERGMFAEGFSGLDGRSTIFDYWSIDSLVAWKNGGKWNTEKLTAEQQTLRQTYQKLLTISTQEEAIRDGSFFDLQYANKHNAAYDSWNVYAFLRNTKDEILLGVANFSDEVKELSIEIPKHAFDCLSITDGISLSMHDLINALDCEVLWSSKQPISIRLEPYGICLLKGKF